MPVATCVFFGSAWQLVHLRHPKQPNRAAGAVRLRERRDCNIRNLFCSQKKPLSLREPNIGRTHRSSACDFISVTVAQRTA